MNAAIIDTLEKRETTFKKNLKDSNGKVFEIAETTKIGESSIYRLWTKDQSYYYTSKAKKTQICLHFTVGSITGDIATLTKPGNKVSVHYVVDRLGNIYNLIPLNKEKNWSYHLGAKCIGTNGVMSKSAIGIEISNYGPLNKHADGYYNAYKQLYCVEDRHVENILFRNYNYYSRMTEAQKTAVYELVNWLCEQCDIPHNYKLEGMFENDKCAQEFTGIFTHAQVRKDKFDLPYAQVKYIKEKWEESLLPPEPVKKDELVKTEDITFAEIRKNVEKSATSIKTTAKKEPTLVKEDKPWYVEILGMITGLFAKIKN